MIAVTGGLAIPFVAAAGSGLVTTIGAGVAGVTGSTAVMTGAVTLATGITIVGGNGVVVGGVLAGVGGGIASKKWKRVLKDEGEAAVREWGGGGFELDFCVAGWGTNGEVRARSDRRAEPQAYFEPQAWFEPQVYFKPQAYFFAAQF